MASFYMPPADIDEYDLTKFTHLPVAKPFEPPVSSPQHVSHIPLASTSTFANANTNALAFAPTQIPGIFRGKHHDANIGTRKVEKAATVWRPSLAARHGGRMTSAAHMSGQNPLFRFA